MLASTSHDDTPLPPHTSPSSVRLHLPASQHNTLAMSQSDQALGEEPEMEVADASDAEEEAVEAVDEDGPVAAD